MIHRSEFYRSERLQHTFCVVSCWCWFTMHSNEVVYVFWSRMEAIVIHKFRVYAQWDPIWVDGDKLLINAAGGLMFLISYQMEKNPCTDFAFCNFVKIWSHNGGLKLTAIIEANISIFIYFYQVIELSKRYGSYGFTKWCFKFNPNSQTHTLDNVSMRFMRW